MEEPLHESCVAKEAGWREPSFGPGVVYIFFSSGLVEQFRWQQTNGTFRANMILRQGGSGRSQLHAPLELRTLKNIEQGPPGRAAVPLFCVARGVIEPAGRSQSSDFFLSTTQLLKCFRSFDGSWEMLCVRVSPVRRWLSASETPQPFGGCTD